MSLSGFSDFTREAFSSIKIRVHYALGDLPGKSMERMEAASLISCITPDDPPFLIHHGDKDGVAPHEQSQVLNNRWKQARVPSTLVVVKNGPHNLQGDNLIPIPEELSKVIMEFLETEGR